MTYLRRLLPVRSYGSWVTCSERSHNKLKPLYLHYYSVYDHQTWQDGDLSWRAPTHNIIRHFGHVFLQYHMKIYLIRHLEYVINVKSREKFFIYFFLSLLSQDLWSMNLIGCRHQGRVVTNLLLIFVQRKKLCNRHSSFFLFFLPVVAFERIDKSYFQFFFEVLL